jgi:OOP family OmpA-OmpF porin
VPLQRVSYSAESMFAFDRSELRPEGKTALDTFARELAGTQFDSITVEGHTDRLGTDVYNQKLSLERAEAVKSYLVAGGIDAAKVNALGKGETTPVTKAEECKGQAQNAQLIACLAPDRRVEIEVSGTR